MNILAEEIIEYINEALSEVFEAGKKLTNLSFHELVEIHDNYVVAEFYGGLNGNGDWVDYLTDITDIFSILQFDGNYKCWLVDLHNDCLDDVFYLKIGIKK